MYSAKVAVLSTFFYSTLAKCVWNATCPCGPSNSTFKSCLDSVPASADSCATWANCATCGNDTNECLTCIKGWIGPTCNLSTSEPGTTGSRSLRQKRHHNTDTDTCSVEGIEDCGKLRCPKSGSLKCVTRGKIKTCTATCLPGYLFKGMESESTIDSTCDGHDWLPRKNFPECVSGGQCDIEMKGGGYYNCSTGVSGTYCDIHCHSTHTTKQFYCFPGADWDPPLPSCARAKDKSTTNCPDPGFIRDGTRSTADGKADPRSGSFKEYSVLNYYCNTGYVMNGNRDLTCLPTGRWSSKLPSCEAAAATSASTMCRDPGQVANARRLVFTRTTSTSQTFLPGESIVFTCNSGFTRTGESHLTCLRTGGWSASLPVCRNVATFSTQAPLIYCNDPGIDPNGERFMGGSRIRITGNFPQGTQLDYTCRSGYTLQGQKFLFCRNTGRWSATRPSCQSNPRSQATAPERERLPEDDDEDEVTVYCDSPDPIDKTTWTVIPPSGERNIPANPEVDGYPENTRLEFVCDAGYAMVGRSTLHCEQSGIWSDDFPRCTKDCGRSRQRTTMRISHGVKTVPGEWPWTVAIVNISSGYSQLRCGGSLIDTRTVLTAAHCLMNPTLQNTNNIRLYFGKFYGDDGRDDSSKVQIRTPSTFIVHPRYDPTTMDNDIAIVRFLSPIQYSERIQPVCLPTRESSRKNIRPYSKGYVLGWGTTERNLPADELLMAYVPVVTSRQCLSAYERQNLQMPITGNMFCAGFPEGKSSACPGDSGGPIVFHDKATDRHTLEGIVSFGPRGQCGLAQRYTVFTQVSKYSYWIERSM